MKQFLILLFIALSFSKTTFSQVQKQPEKQYTITLPLSSWETILQSLGEQKANLTYNIIQSIQIQVGNQDKIPPPKPTEKPASDSTKNKKP